MWATRPDDVAHLDDATPDAPLPEGDGLDYPQVGLILRVHPRYLVDEDDLALLDLWRAWRPGMGGAGHLPFSGGAAEQPACVMDALALIDGVAAAVRPKRD